MERRRNRPVKYDRELVGKTITAMQRVEEIRQSRQGRHWEGRMRKAAKVQLKNDKKQLEQEIHLVKAPHVKEAERKKVRQVVEEVEAEEMSE